MLYFWNGGQNKRVLVIVWWWGCRCLKNGMLVYQWEWNSYITNQCTRIVAGLPHCCTPYHLPCMLLLLQLIIHVIDNPSWALDYLHTMSCLPPHLALPCSEGVYDMATEEMWTLSGQGADGGMAWHVGCGSIDDGCGQHGSWQTEYRRGRWDCLATRPCFFFLIATIYSAVLMRQSVDHVKCRPINLNYNAYIITEGEDTHCRPSNGSRVFAYPGYIWLNEKERLESHNYKLQLTWLYGVGMTTRI